MMGSIHVGTKALYPLPQQVITRLEASDSLILEIDIEDSANVTLPQSRLSSKQVLDSKQIEDLNNIAKELGLPIEALLNSAPWQTALTLQLMQLNKLGYDSQLGIDTYFHTLAKQQQIHVEPLETAQFQMDLLSSLPNDGQELLESAINEWSTSKQIMNCLLESWQSGDTNKLTEFSQVSDMSTTMHDRFIRLRNQNWANQLDKMAQEPEVQRKFMVVGTLHLVGKDNVIDMLKQRGFKVSQVSTSRRATCSFD